MKRFLIVTVVLTLFAIAANAQCDTDAVTATYERFVANYKGTPEQKKLANEAAKEFVSKFGHCPGDAEKKIVAYLKDWQANYTALQKQNEARRIESECTTAVDKTPAQAFERCRPYISKDPENLRGYLLLSLAGFKTAKTADKSTRDEAVRAMRKSLELIKAGKTVDPWVFGGNKEEAVSTLEFFSASLTLDTEPAEAAAAMLRLAHSNSSYSKDPNTYYYLARSLHNGEVKKQIAEYNTKCSGATPPADCEGFNNRIEAMIDRVIDAYARAVALGDGKAEHASITTAAKPELVELYKKRHGDSGAGLDKFVSEVLSKPIP